jgi:hypothetical protein
VKGKTPSRHFWRTSFKSKCPPANDHRQGHNITMQNGG